MSKNCFLLFHIFVCFSTITFACTKNGASSAADLIDYGIVGAPTEFASQVSETDAFSIYSC